ncbi:helix-turn-helix domain-containing protein [Streptomyces sp. 4N509B]|uniref:helix-turn-helix domain-containing protein n=1 Tax=Streptomyces sp. 4N509B TaxID=3457413 RepID=UPI003FD48811
MPPRSAPTARQRRLGAELRKLRERAGLTSVVAATQLGVTQSRLSAIEGGRYGVSGERVRTFALHYGCSDEALIDALAAMTVGRQRRWWDEYRDVLPADMLDLAELEHHATAIRTTQVSHLPGLLQTIDYARCIFRQHVPKLPAPLLEYRTSLRIKRQQIFLGPHPTPYQAVIHEAALRMRFGGAKVTRAQLTHINEMSEHDHITVRVVPFAAGDFPGSGQTVLYAEGPVPQLDTVQLDTEHGCELLDAEAELVNYRTSMDRFNGLALSPADSREFVHQIIKTL